MSKLRCLLINPVIRPKEPQYNIPLGLAYIAAVISDRGHDVAICDGNAYRLSPEEIIAEIGQENWDIIGMGSLVTTYSWQKKMFRLLRKEFPGAILVAGGGLATSLQRDLMDWVPEIDIICIGEGERTIAQVLDNFDSRSWHEVRGIYYRQNGEVLQTPPQPLLSEEELSQLPYPRYDLLPLEEVYFKYSGIPLSPEAKVSQRRLSMETARGCPFTCSFCIDLPSGLPRNKSFCDESSVPSDLVSNSKKTRYFNSKWVVGLMKQLRLKYAVDFLSFTDENMTVNRETVMELCSLIEQEGLNNLLPPLRFGSAAHVNTIDREMMEKLKAAGCSYLDLGLESMNKDVLTKEIAKGSTPARNEWGFNECLHAGIYPITNFMLGLPGDTVQSIYDTTKFITDNEISCGPFFVTPYPRTALFERCRNTIMERFGSLENFVIQCEDDVSLDFVVNLTSYNDAELLGMRQMMINHDIDQIIKFAEQKGEKVNL